MMRNLLTGATVTLLALIGTPGGGDGTAVTTSPPEPSLVTSLLNGSSVDTPLDTSVDTPPADTAPLDTPPLETPPPAAPSPTDTTSVDTPSLPDTPPITIPSFLTTPPSTDTSTPAAPATSPTDTAPTASTATAAPAAPAPSTPVVPTGGTVHITTVPALAGVHLVVGGEYVTTGAGGFASVHVGTLAGIAGSVRLAGDAANGDLVEIGRVVPTASAPGTESVTVGLNVTASVRLAVVAGAVDVSPGSVHAIRLHSSAGQVKTVDPNATPTVWLQAQRISLQYGRLVSRAITWTVDSVSAESGVAVTVSRAAFDPNRASTWTLVLSPVGGQVHVATVPPTAGVHLTVAGVPAITGSDGRATVTVADLDNVSRKVRLAATTAGADTVSLTRVLSSPSARRSRSVIVGLDVTVPVRLSVVAGTAGIAPNTVRQARLHSSTGRTVTVDPNATAAVPLLAVRTMLQHGRLVAERVGWTVDSITAASGVAVTTSRTPFEPTESRAWTIALRPVAGSVSITTVPPTAGVHLSVDGVSLTTGADGTGSATVANLNDVAHKVRLDGVTAGGSTVAVHRVATRPMKKDHARALTVALQVSRPVTLAFTDPSGAPVPASRIDSVTLHGDGGQVVLRGAELTAPVDLVSTIPSLVHGRWQVRPVIYSVAEVHLAGSNAVFAGRERFAPANSATWHISLALYTATIRIADALFGRSLATTAHLTGQDGEDTVIAVPRGGVSLPSTVRGMYTLTVDDAVIGGTNRILVSGDTAADVRVLTIGDIAVLAGVAVILLIALLLVGAWIGRGDDAARRSAPPPSRISAPRPRRSQSRPAWSPLAMSIALVALIGAGVLASALVTAPGARGATPPAAGNAPAAASPAFVYFYQWYTDSSWRRAKEDTPLIGPYSSANPTVLRTQIAQIKAAGIDGILTSWKNNDQLNNNLQMLIDQATPEHLDLGVVYEALDFARHPLPVDTVQSDMLYLLDRWGAELKSPYFGAPVIIWTGTNEYTPAQVRSVHDALAGRALLLAASKNVGDYNAIADDVDGEAYYWSSADPSSPKTAEKLAAMGAAVRAHGGIWIAPAAAGFDGRTLGHTRVIARNSGQSLVQSLKIAYASDPTAVGVISWNEWSENTYIEPGQRYGSTELHALTNYLRDIHAGVAPSRQSAGAPPAAGGAGPDSAAPSATAGAPTSLPRQGSGQPGAGEAAQGPAGSVQTPGEPRAGSSAAPSDTAHRTGFRWQWADIAVVVALALAGIVATVAARRHSRRDAHHR